MGGEGGSKIKRAKRGPSVGEAEFEAPPKAMLPTITRKKNKSKPKIPHGERTALPELTVTRAAR